MTTPTDNAFAAASALFTPVQLETVTVDTKTVTLANIADHLSRIEAECRIATEVRKRNYTAINLRRQELTKILLLVPGYKTKTGQLCAAGLKLVDAVAPRPSYLSESDIWSNIWYRIRPAGNSTSCYSRSDMERNLAEIKRVEVRETQRSSRVVKAREVILAKFQADPKANADLGSLLVSGTDAQVVNKAEAILYDEYVAEHYPEGTEVYIKCCDDCSLWVVGDHRCSCGNRRMSLESYGSFLDGTSGVYPAAY